MSVTAQLSDIKAAENIGSTPESLAIQLLLTLFSVQELRKGNCTKPRKEGIVMLDPTRITAIRGKMLFFTQACN